MRGGGRAQAVFQTRSVATREYRTDIVATASKHEVTWKAKTSKLSLAYVKLPLLIEEIYGSMISESMLLHKSTLVVRFGNCFNSI